jgi:hypothetical protein
VELGGNYPPLPPITQHTGSIFFLPNRRPLATPRIRGRLVFTRHGRQADAAGAFLRRRPAGLPESTDMTRPPLPTPPALGSARRVGLHRPPPTLDGAVGEGSTAARASIDLAGEEIGGQVPNSALDSFSGRGSSGLGVATALAAARPASPGAPPAWAWARPSFRASQAARQPPV